MRETKKAIKALDRVIGQFEEIGWKWARVPQVQALCDHLDVEQEDDGPDGPNRIFCNDCGADLSWLYERDHDGEAKDLEVRDGC